MLHIFLFSWISFNYTLLNCFYYKFTKVVTRLPVNVNKSSTTNIHQNIFVLQVNGVGKSTNLAKICFWLIENDMSVLIAACDTFRAGAVEQLRTHARHLNALHPPDRHRGRNMVHLYEKGYGMPDSHTNYEEIIFFC